MKLINYKIQAQNACIWINETERVRVDLLSVDAKVNSILGHS
jgi:hypothetical protein